MCGPQPSGRTRPPYMPRAGHARPLQRSSGPRFVSPEVWAAVLFAYLRASLFNDLPFDEMQLFAVDQLVILVALAREQHNVAGLGHFHRGVNRLAAVRDAGVGCAGGHVARNVADDVLGRLVVGIVTRALVRASPLWL